MTEISTLSGQSRVTRADWTWRSRSTRCATAASFTRISGTPAGTAAALRTWAGVTRCVPVTCTPRTTKNRDSSSAQPNPATSAMAISAKKTARHR